MSVVPIGTYQGSFTSTGKAKTLRLRSDLDWLWVYNQTQQYATAAAQGVEYYWQRGYTQGRGTIYTKTTTTNALAIGQIAANAGFFLVDSSINVPGAATATTAISNAAPPILATPNTGLVTEGDIIRIGYTPGVRQFAGYETTVGTTVANTSFQLINMPQIAATVTAAGTYRYIPFNPLFYPSIRLITGINTTTSVVTLSVTHFYTVGQKMRFVVPVIDATSFGTTELDGLVGTIIAIGEAGINGSTNTITVDIDMSSFTAFAFPTDAEALAGFTPAQVIPIGENTRVALDENVDMFSDATENFGYIGIRLQPGVNSPAGTVNGGIGDKIYWVAGKSFSVDNE